jgi:hypothetical protein
MSTCTPQISAETEKNISPSNQLLLRTSDALKIKVNTIVIHYTAVFILIFNA